MTARLPTALKVMRGTDQPSRRNPDEPEPPVLEVGSRPPDWLKGPRRRRAWSDLSEMLRNQRLLTVMDAAALAFLVDAYGDYLEASDLIAGETCGFCGQPMSTKGECNAPGEWIELTDDDTGEKDRVYMRQAHEPGRRYYSTRTKEGSLMIRPHPAMTVRQDAWKRVVALLTQFGMSPSSRARVTAGPAVERDPMADLLGDLGS